MDWRRWSIAVGALAVAAGLIALAFSLGWGWEILGKVIPIAIIVAAIGIFQRIRGTAKK